MGFLPTCHKIQFFTPYLKHEVFACGRKRREAMLGGGGVRGHAPRKFFEKSSDRGAAGSGLTDENGGTTIEIGIQHMWLKILSIP